MIPNEEKIKQYIQNNIICHEEKSIWAFKYNEPEELTDNLFNIIRYVNYSVRFSGHYVLSLKQLKEIAEILNEENIFISHNTDRDGDRDTYIEW